MSETSDKKNNDKERVVETDSKGTDSVTKPVSLEDLLGYTFKDTVLRDLAVTHASLHKKGVNNERLEFLGDRVLGLSVANTLYACFPTEKEGALAKRHAALVQEGALASVAERIGLSAFLKLSTAEVKAGGAKNKTILADALEALIGAVFIDGGYGSAEKMVKRLWQGLIQTESLPPSDPKTRLQEWAQSKGLALPEYRVLARTGTDHKPLFTVEVVVEAVGSVSALAPTKREAEKKAAEKMMIDMAAKIESVVETSKVSKKKKKKLKQKQKQEKIDTAAV